MSGDHFVIIGNGPAGNQAALSLRECAPHARITLISRDHGGCYRPHLLPRFIAREIVEEDLYVSTVDEYREKGIKLRSGQQVVDADLSGRKLILDHKEVIPFTGLIIAVGGTPRIPEHLIVFQDLMITLKTLQDARRWIEVAKISFALLSNASLFEISSFCIRISKSSSYFFSTS